VSPVAAAVGEAVAVEVRRRHRPETTKSKVDPMSLFPLLTRIPRTPIGPMQVTALRRAMGVGAQAVQAAAMEPKGWVRVQVRESPKATR
jgi:hypothetical protein